jgi:hypothetical protein
MAPILDFLQREKSAEKYFMKSASHSSSPQHRGHSFFTFSHWANKLRFLMELHSKLKREFKNVLFPLPCSCIVTFFSLQEACDLAITLVD